MWNEFQVRSHMISPSLHRLSYPLLGSVMSDRFISYGSSSHGVLSPKSQVPSPNMVVKSQLLSPEKPSKSMVNCQYSKIFIISCKKIARLVESWIELFI